MKKSDNKSNNKWGFLAPTRAEAERMEAKYGEHFTALIDYMKVIFPDIDDWEEWPGLPKVLGNSICSNKWKKIVSIVTVKDRSVKVYGNGACADYDSYVIDYATQLTNATVRHIFGIDVAEPLFDENTCTYTRPWIEHEIGVTAEQALEGRYIGDEKQYKANFDAYRAIYDNIGLSKIIVEKLFDLFSYEIELNADKNISILIGPNGCGKTTILKIVRFMLTGEGDIEEIIKIPFKSITCVLADGQKIQLKSLKNRWDAFINDKKVAILSKNEKGRQSREYVSIFEESIEYNKREFEELREKNKELEKEIIELSLNAEYDQGEKKRKKNLKKEDKEYTDRYCEMIIFKEALERHGLCFDAEFIFAQRLFSKGNDAKEDVLGMHQYLDTISKIQKDFKRFCAQKEAEYNEEKIETAKNVLRLIKRIQDNKYDPDVLEDAVFEAKWREFAEDKFLEGLKMFFKKTIVFEAFEEIEDASPDDIINKYKNADEDKKKILCLYLREFSKLLDKFGFEFVRVLRFNAIIDDRFKITKKQLHYRHGEIYLTAGEGKNEKEIPLEVLSSGEKNDFIMFYNLIFNCKNSKVFIDEPEISLHIEWQERFIEDLYYICKINNIQALVATHSPSIINGHFDMIANWEIKDEQ